MNYTVLIIDDHPAIIEGYKSILNYNKDGIIYNFTETGTCEEAYAIITNEANKEAFDVILVDFSLPPFEEKKLFSGEDILMLVNKHFLKTKKVMLTSHIEGILLNRIIKNCNLDGLLVKSDFTGLQFQEAIKIVLEGTSYFSPFVEKIYKEYNPDSKLLDNYNAQIITMLAQGYKSKSLQDHLHLSKSAIDKRKVQIKIYLDIEKGTDEDIVREAKKRGFI